jgi:aspartyl-tRNA(Asn)/glutamyl-tRNA(Gln) amidotransferase subunit A
MTAPSPALAADPGAVADLAEAVHGGRTDPVRLLQACLARIDAVDDKVQGFCFVDRDGAAAQAAALRAEAAAGEFRGPLHGIPVAVKDVIDVAGIPTRAGSRTRADIAPSASDATVVARLRAAGAVILGKAHTTEFAFFEGPPPTRNPHDLTRTPGGSSAGPAAVVAGGMVPLSLGTQTAGSVSRPAAYCGIAAFKPSTLSWPDFGVVPFAPSFDTIGVFGYRTVDATIVARALMPAFVQRSARPAAAANAAVAVVEDPIFASASPGVATTLRGVAEKLAAAGTHTRSLPSCVAFADLIALHKTIVDYELSRVHVTLLEAADGAVTAALREAIERGGRIDDAAYQRGLRALASAQTQFWSLAADFDALLFPATPDVAPVGMKTGDPRYIIPFTALGGPMASMPVGFDHGLPLGIILASAPGTDHALADIADRLAPLIETPR